MRAQWEIAVTLQGAVAKERPRQVWGNQREEEEALATRGLPRQTEGAVTWAVTEAVGSRWRPCRAGAKGVTGLCLCLLSPWSPAGRSPAGKPREEPESRSAFVSIEFPKAQSRVDKRGGKSILGQRGIANMWDVQSALGFRVSVLKDSGSLSLCVWRVRGVVLIIFLSVWRHSYCSILYTCTFVRLWQTFQTHASL